MRHLPTRRTLLKSIACAGAGLGAALPRLVRAASPNGLLQHAGIGVDGMGWVDLNSIARDSGVRIAALCDVDTSRMAKAAERWPDAARYQDFRELLAREGDRIDCVSVSTPDHMHAPISISAMRGGKHVYCQKPLTHSVHEARRMRIIARETGRITQMGIQGQATIRNRLVTQLVQEGAIGRVQQIHVWIPHPGDVYMQGMDRPTYSDPVPDHLDWDLWLGVAPARPFIRAYRDESPHKDKPVYHPFYWRGWCDFGTGALGDIGCHSLDPIAKALELGAPTSIRSEGPVPNGETFPEWSIIHFEFPGTPYTAGPRLPLTWYNGGKVPSADIFPEEDRNLFNPGRGALLIGEEGSMLLTGSAPRLLPSSKFRGHSYPRLEERDHYLQWTAACRGKGQTTAGFDYAGPVTETVLLGNVAMHLPQRTIQWDAAATTTGESAADERLGRAYRAGWKIEGLA